MAQVQSAFLCQSLLFNDTGTFSALGIGISDFHVPSLPTVISFTVLVGVKWEPAESGVEHLAVVQVATGDEVVARVTMSGTAPPWRDHVGSGTNFAQGLAFDARRPGAYKVSVMIDGVEVGDLPFEIRSELPPL